MLVEEVLAVAVVLVDTTVPEVLAAPQERIQDPVLPVVPAVGAQGAVAVALTEPQVHLEIQALPETLVVQAPHPLVWVKHCPEEPPEMRALVEMAGQVAVVAVVVTALILVAVVVEQLGRLVTEQVAQVEAATAAGQTRFLVTLFLMLIL